MRDAPICIKTMARPRSKYPPATPAQRQRKCRAIKRGEYHYCQQLPSTPQLTGPNVGGPPAALPAPMAMARPLPGLPAPAQTKPALPAPPTPPSTAIQKAVSPSATSLALSDECSPGDTPRLSLPPAVAARLRSLIARQDAGKSLTTAELAEAQGLLDIAEYFVVQRMRRRLAA
jgi:hypothetical protein